MKGADFEGHCSICDGQIRKGELIVPRHGTYIHRRCAPGQDDE